MGQSPESNQVIEKSLLNSKFVVSRLLRGAENRNQGGSSASADFELEAEKARLSPISEKAVAFLRAGERGGGEALFAKKENNDYEYIEFHQGKIAFGEKFIQESNFFAKSTLKIATPDSVLLCVRAPVGIVNITQRAIGIGRGLCALKSEFCDNLFLYYVLQSMQRYFESKATGSTFKAINIDIIKETLIPLPPLEEQAHIVALLDKLFMLSKGLRVS
ncbi:restriction endonuclease subunit S [uncultured Helicobacter sp.]|uniref:restriction endonuclease subunit S n=1 Tax=uncultured Helicobacter sp. TaxID=175537 RepID=UPI00374F5A08